MESIPKIYVTNHIDIAHHIKGQNCQVANFFKSQQISYTAAFLKRLETHVHCVACLWAGVVLGWKPE